MLKQYHEGNSKTGVSRRELLKILAAAGACAALPGSELFGQLAKKSTARGGRIDVHHHFVLPLPGGVKLGPASEQNEGRDTWTVEKSLEQMDKFDIAVAILSRSVQFDVDAVYDGTDKGRSLTRAGNEYGAKLVSAHPKRLGFFAAIPFPDIDGDMKEIEYAYETLKCDGISIHTNDAHNRWPGDPYFEPMWKELDRRKAVIFMHPSVPQCCRNLNVGVKSYTNEIDFETTRACTSFLAHGVLHRYPNLHIITTHSGGTLPVLAGRIKDLYPADPEHAEYIPNGVLPELKKFYFDIAHGTYPPSLSALLNFALPSHILFGTDYAPITMEITTSQLPTSGLSKELTRAIERGNAELLFPRFKA